MAMLETPSRIWRRIQAIEGRSREMPSLPSLPAFEDSAAASTTASESTDPLASDDDDNISLPAHSTPAASTLRAETASASRFASSIASRSAATARYTSASRALSSASGVGGDHESFDISGIPDLPDEHQDGSDYLMDIESKLPPEVELDRERDLSLTEALESVSRTSSPLDEEEHKIDAEPTPKKTYDYSVSLRSEPKPSPFDKFRNVALRKRIPGTPTRASARTPSLTRTSTGSPSNSSLASTPRSTRSPNPAASPALFPLPRSATASPAVLARDDSESEALEFRPRGVDAYPPLDSEDEDVPTVSEEQHVQMSAEDDESHMISDDENALTRHFTLPSAPPSPSEADQSSGLFPSAPEPGSASTSASSREPTFSDEGPTPSPPPSVSQQPYRSPSAAPSSLAPSVASTPTPDIPPRARPRFSLPATPGPGDDPERRRSFLLSVINSTARPRPRFAAPAGGRTPALAGVTLRTAWAGATPRMAHPLARTVTATGSEESSGSGAEDAGGGALAPWSPADMDDRASFISTASSHDLTTHPRANASFDPVLQAGAGGHGVGRFNAAKLNAYLHGLNRRLQEENEALVMRLRNHEEERENEEGARGRLISEGRGRRISAGGGSALGNVEEDVGGEGWAEEKRLLEEHVGKVLQEMAENESTQAEVKRALEGAEKALEEERCDRARDKERWRDRMGEVERGVDEVVRDLERKLQDAEVKANRADRRLAEVEGERNAAVARAEKAESGRELSDALKEANVRAEQAIDELRSTHAQIRELEEEVMRANGGMDELEKEVEKEKEKLAMQDLAGKVREKDMELDDAQKKVAIAEAQAVKVEEQLRATRTYVSEIEEEAGAAVERIESLEAELARAHDLAEEMDAEREREREAIEMLDGEKERAAELARQMEEALEAAETKMLADEEEVARLKGKVSSLERDLEREREKADAQQQQQRRDPSSLYIPTEPDVDIEALEDELDAANKEIARLTTLLNQSPARKAINKAKDTKIEMLEREKEELTERVKVLRGEVGATPSRIVNASGISPIHRQVLSMNIRTPKTPGGPLKDLSWLNNTAADLTVSPLIAEISRLQRELDRANESIDDKLDKLEDAGFGVVGLTKKLEDARARIIMLEDEIARLTRREDRRVKRLQKARCLKCHSKVDSQGLSWGAEGDESSLEISCPSLPSNPPTPPSKTSEALRADLRTVNSQLDLMKQQWENERHQLLGERAVLQDAASRLNLQVRTAKEEVKKAEKAGEKVKAGIQGELDQAKAAIAELETDLKAERARLRVLGTEQDRVCRDKEQILLQLQRTESDMDDVRRQLQKFKQENHDLETELRVNANAEQKARLLEVKVVENTETIEQLRQERSFLAADHKRLQRQFSEISEQANRLRDEHAASQTSHDNRRHQLDLHLLEIEDLRQALSAQNDQLHRAESEKDRIAAEKNTVARTVAALEADLKRVRMDAEAFGRDLKLLRATKEKTETKQKEETSSAERAKKQAQAQIRLLNEQLDGQREKAKKAQEELTRHVCAIDEQQLSAMKVQHNKECKGLIVQIRYLKAKFTRESSLRCDLGYQKHYLLVLLSRYEKSEQTILASIAQIGFPVPPPAPPNKRRSLKCATLCIIFLLRVKRASDLWRDQCASKEAIAAALHEVRRRRVAAVS